MLSQLCVCVNPGINQFLKRTLLNGLTNASFNYQGAVRPRGLQVNNVTNRSKGIICASCCLLNAGTKQYNELSNISGNVNNSNKAQNLCEIQIILNTITKEVNILQKKRMVSPEYKKSMKRHQNSEKNARGWEL